MASSLLKLVEVAVAQHMLKLVDEIENASKPSPLSLCYVLVLFISATGVTVRIGLMMESDLAVGNGVLFDQLRLIIGSYCLGNLAQMETLLLERYIRRNAKMIRKCL